MKALRRHMAAAMTLVLGTMAFGCGPAQPPLHPVEGSVRFEGRPPVGFAVEFSSLAESTKGVSAVGVIDPQGRFTLETRQAGRQKPGAVAGPHKVVVLPPPAFGGEGKSMEAVPLRYADYGQSGLTAEVQPGGPNEISLELSP